MNWIETNKKIPKKPKSLKNVHFPIQVLVYYRGEKYIKCCDTVNKCWLNQDGSYCCPLNDIKYWAELPISPE